MKAIVVVLFSNSATLGFINYFINVMLTSQNNMGMFSLLFFQQKLERKTNIIFTINI